MRNTFIILVVFLCFFPSSLLAQNSGGPDAFGYVWRDNSMGGAPVYNWIDITGIGTQVLGLADDNFKGPFSIGFDFYYYTDSVYQFWVGSNGYISLNTGVQISSGGNPAWPDFPTADGKDNLLGPMLTDLSFGGAGNPGECYYWTNNLDSLIISYIDVPFWNSGANYSGKNTFQVFLIKGDSSITFQYKEQIGTWDPAYNSVANPVVIGIEDETGTIGLHHSSYTLPDSGMAIKFSLDPPCQTIVIGTDPTCAGDSNGAAVVSLISGVPPWTFIWSTAPSDTDSLVSGLAAGIYYVTVTDFVGCTNQHSVQLQDPATLQTSFNKTDPTCVGDSNGSALVSLINGVPPWTFAWSTSPSDTDSVITDLVAGIYYITVTDSMGCTVHDSIELQDPDTLQTSTYGTDPTCAGDNNGSAMVSLIGGVPPFTFSWSNSASDTNYYVTGLVAGIYHVTVTDAAGCSVQDSVELQDPDTLIVSVWFDLIDTVHAQAIGGAGPPYTYLWSSGQTTASIQVASMGTYSVTVTDSTGCMGMGSVVISTVKEVQGQGLIRISPNISSSKFNVEIDWPSPVNILLHVVDVHGRTVFDQVQDQLMHRKIIVDLSSKPRGVYFIHVNAGSVDLVKKIILQ